MRMATRNNSVSLRIAFCLGVFLSLAGATGFASAAQAQAPAAPVAASPAASASELGTVKTIAGDTLTMATDAGQTVTVTVPSEAKVLQLAVGSTDLKTAKPSQFSDVAVGDRVLAIGRAGDAAASFNALRVVLMKSSDIAQRQADWKARGVGGIVSSVDAASGAITLTVGAKKLVVHTGGKTEFKRFSGDSVKYEDAKPGTLAQIQAKDQLQARGAKSADGTTIEAEEVVSGSFKNLSGLITSIVPGSGIDMATGKITFKDLATKKVMTVNVTEKCDIRNVPLMMATRIAAQTNGGGQSGGRGGRGGGAGAAYGAGGGAGQGAGQGYAAGGAQRSAGVDLSQMTERLPTGTLADLKVGDAVMIVASEPSPGSSTVDAIKLLTGVEPILTANPNGGMDLSMSLGGGGGGEGGE
jgi:co-chaperonin GroES (HSP10)